MGVLLMGIGLVMEGNLLLQGISFPASGVALEIRALTAGVSILFGR